MTVKQTAAHTVAERLRALDASLDLLDQAVAESFGIGRTDLRAMEALSRAGPMSHGQLAGTIGLTTGSVTALVDRMERAGYLRRVRESADRRTVLVTLTPRARDRERATFSPLVRDTLALLAHYDSSALTTISDFLEQARAVADAARARVRRAAARQAPNSSTSRGRS